MRRRTTWYLAATVALAIAGGVILPKLPSQTGSSAREKFGSGRSAAAPVAFDGERAMGHLRDICKLGPRVSGTAGMKRQQDLIEKHFTQLGAVVTRQTFSAKQHSRPAATEMTNLLVTFHPQSERRVLFCCHYDTRPIADQEPNERHWREPFISANDGASGVAWLMELGRHVKEMKLNVGIDFAIFDGEEYIFDPGPGRDKYFFGSEHFARDYARNRPKHRYTAGILLDLAAGKNATFPYEQNSLFHASALAREIWAVAGELNELIFQPKPGPEVLDDHIALNRAGIPTVDIIDFEYPHWHRLSDTPEQCSGDTMTRVARVLTTWVSRVK